MSRALAGLGSLVLLIGCGPADGDAGGGTVIVASAADADALLSRAEVAMYAAKRKTVPCAMVTGYK